MTEPADDWNARALDVITDVVRYHLCAQGDETFAVEGPLLVDAARLLAKHGRCEITEDRADARGETGWVRGVWIEQEAGV